MGKKKNKKLDKLIDLISLQLQLQLQTQAQTQNQTSTTKIKLTELKDKYVEEIEFSKGSVTNAHIRSYNKIIKDFIFITGKDKNIDEITVTDIEKFIHVLKKLPKNYERIKNFEIEELSKYDMLEKQAYGTIFRKIHIVNSLFDFAKKREYIQKNIVKKYLPAKQQNNSEVLRTSFTDDDLDLLFGLNSFTKKFEETLTDTPERVWIPIIALFTGMRQNEICQLYVEDIKLKDNIFYFDLNDKFEKRLKTAYSKRKVPIPQILIDAGIIEFINSLEEERVFHNLKYSKLHQNYSSTFGVNFKNILRKKITDKRKVFHSFRHLVAKKLLQIERDYNQRSIYTSLILGHSDQNITATLKNYNQEGVNLNDLKNVIDKVTYDSESLNCLLKKLKRHYYAN